MTTRERARLDGVHYRGIRDEADYEALATLIAACNLHDGIDYLPDATRLRLDLQQRIAAEPARDVRLAELDGRLVGFGAVRREVRGGSPVYFLFGAVHPEVRRQGLGTAILARNEARLREIAAEHGTETGREFATWADTREGGAAELFAANGFRPIRFYAGMRRSVEGELPVAQLPDGLEIRPVELAHHRAIFEADNEAFRDHWGHREQDDSDFERLFADPELDTSLWRVAWEGDEVAGSVQTFVYATENEQVGARRGWLEHVSVRKPWRRRGLGRALIVSAMEALRERGMAEAMLGVDSDNPTGALQLYESLGFEVVERGVQYRRSF